MIKIDKYKGDNKMKFHLFSVIVGTEACIASCPFCVSNETPTKENMICPKINWRNFKIAANLANRSNINTVVLTSRGEPLLFPEQITDYLDNLKEFQFPFIELQTNGILLEQKKDYYEKYLNEWYEKGLTTIAISVVSYCSELNRKNYLPKQREYIDLPNLIKRLHNIGFSVRLACVCCKGMMDSALEVFKLIQFAKDNNVEQITLRPVNDEFRRDSTAKWINNNKLSMEQKEEIKKALDLAGTKLLEINRVGTVYDVNGQNVCLSLPLNKNTRDYDPENGRQLIFFQDGHIRYEWEMSGGILL